MGILLINVFSLRVQSRDNHGLIPLTVKQISEAYHSGEEKSNFVINGSDVTNVLLILRFIYICFKSICIQKKLE